MRRAMNRLARLSVDYSFWMERDEHRAELLLGDLGEAALKFAATRREILSRRAKGDRR